MSAYAQALDALQRGDMAAAEAAAGAGLRAEPGDLPLLRLKGYILQTTNRFAEAAACYAEVVARAPDDWEIWNNLGNARRALGDHQGTVAALRRALSIRSDIPPILANLAAALTEAGDLQASLDVYAQALRQDPGNGPYLLASAQLLRWLERYDEALDLLGPQPESFDALLERARSLSGLRRLDDAEAAYRLAIQRQPGAVEPYLELGIILERAGRLDAIAPLLASAGAAGVADEALAYLKALLLRKEGRNGEALEWARRAPASLEPVRTQRLISQLADREGDYALAFQAASQANRLSAEEHPEATPAAAAYRGQVASMFETISPAWVKRWSAAGPESDRAPPAFLVGFPRSGTTLLDTFLMGHPQIHVLEELPLLETVMRQAGGMARLPDLEKAEISGLQKLYFETLDEEASPPAGTLVIDKLPLNILGAPLIHRLFPDAPIIFALRHPCDAVLSCFMQDFELNEAMANFLDIEDSARLYDLALSLWQRSRELLPLRVHELKYEELVADPERVLRPLIDFLGLDWTDSLLDHQRTAAARGVISTPSYNQVTQRLHGAASGRWRRYREQLAPVLPVLLPWAEKLGYES